MAAARAAVALAACLAVMAHDARAQEADAFFDSSTLHRVDIWVHSGDWRDLQAHYEEDTRYPARLAWDGVPIYDAAIRSRGGGSRSGTKPGLRVDLDYYHAGPRFPHLRSFVLDNLWQDATGVRETLAMGTYARLGIAAPREAHARLYVNGEYAGLYAIVESVDEDFLARVYGREDGGLQADGYLFDYEYRDPWRFEDLGPTLEPYQARFSDVTRDDDTEEAKWRPVEELVRLINDTPVDALEDVLAGRIDLEQFVRFAAIQNFLAENDGLLGYAGLNNFYLYRPRGRPTHVFFPWDEDNALLTADFPVDMRLDENVLMRGLMQLPTFRAVYYATLQEAAALALLDEEGDGRGWFEREAERQTALIADALREDPVKPFTDAEVEAATAHVRAFGPTRAAFVRCAAARALGQPLPAGCQ